MPRNARIALVAALAATWLACGDDGAGPLPDAAPRDDGAAPPDADGDASTPADAGPPDGAPEPLAPPIAVTRPLVRWVDPFIGTAGLGYGVGSTFPGPQRPFGMVRPGPDTTQPDGALGFEHCSGYDHDDTLVTGFSLTRMHGTGIPDYGVPGLMPVVGMSAERTRQDGYRAALDKATEEASPGYYRVELGEPAIAVELTATDRVALMRFAFPAAAGAEATVLLDVGHVIGDCEIGDGEVEIDPARGEVSGFTVAVCGYSGRIGGMPVYFAARADRPPVAHGVWQAGALAAGETHRRGPDTGAWLSFDAAAEPQVVVAVGISFVDVAHARANLDAEDGGLDFDGVRAESEAVWEQALGRLEVEARSERELRMVYTALYHTLLMPTLASDVDGSYRGLDREVHLAEGYRYYTDLSLWDTFRTLHPWLALVYPEWQLDFLRSLSAMARDDRYVPRWPLGIGETGGMVGDSGALVVADGWLKGLRDFDVDTAYEALLRGAMAAPEPGHPGRGGIEAYMELGWVPIESGGASASVTLEYAYADFALARLAGELGHAEDAALLRARAGNYANLYDPATGFLLGRHADGSFPTDVDLDSWQDWYAEGNAWQYLWYAPHDLEGLAALLGGPDTLLSRLDDLFERSARRRRTPLPDPYYWQGNEPDLHAPWIFAAFDEPARTARWTRWVQTQRYGDGPDGLPGNDDGGTMSAWYLFAALGLYPITAETHYLLGAPTLPHAVVHLPGGDLVIEAPTASEAAVPGGAITLDGHPLARARVEHDALVDGAVLRFE